MLFGNKTIQMEVIQRTSKIREQASATTTELFKEDAMHLREQLAYRHEDGSPSTTPVLARL